MKLMPSLQRGFALPTIVIASIVMLAVMLTAIEAATSTTLGLHTQYYDKLADEAAEAGVNYASACMAANNNTAPWVTAGKNLMPDTNCSGATTSNSHTIMVQGDISTTFSVGQATVTPNSIQLVSTGDVQITRADTGNVWRTYSTTVVSNINTATVSASYIASGEGQECGIIGGATWCWGTNTYGQLGTGDTVSETTPVQVVRQSGALAGKTDKYVSVGAGFACVVTTDNTIYCMGHNSAGQLGNGGSTDSTVPTPVTTSTGLAGKTITGLVSGTNNTCAIASGDLYCWGGNQNGQLGINSTTTQQTPTLVSNIGASVGLPVTAVSAAIYMEFVCAIAGGHTYCWGANDRGELGNNTTTEQHTPVEVYTGGAMGSTRQAVDIATGGNYAATYPNYYATADGTNTGQACAAMDDGTMWCWGSNQYGQMGQGSTSLTQQTQPIQISGIPNGQKVVQVGMSMSTPCALTDSNTLYCWGQNVYGSVGDGTTTNRSVPTAVIVASPGLQGRTITTITGGGNRNCAIASERTFCWGLNEHGQIGDGTTTNRLVPTEATFLDKQLPVAYY